jgi:hypothetical protein
MSITIVPYNCKYEKDWNEFCKDALNATLLHTRDFLSYHNDRFRDLSVLIYESGKLSGIFPAAESLTDCKLVVSHPGATFGGVAHQGRLAGTRMIETMTNLGNYYRGMGYHRLHYKAVPFIYAKSPMQDDIYALFRLGAQRVRCDLSCAIDLSNRRPASKRRIRGLKKAKKFATLSSDPALLNKAWDVVADNLSRKHVATPVHTLTELQLLRDRFQKQIIVRSALIDGQVEASVIFFNTPNVWHAQYIAASERAYDISALDYIFEASINEATLEGVKYFDFGTSNEDDGKVLNDGLFRFKSEFGGGGVAHEFYELSLA